MRRRLILVSTAVTGMVVLAFLVPLFVLVSDLARDTALSDAEREAESLARVLSVLTVSEDLPSAIDTVGEDRIAAINGSVILPSGSVVGLPVPDDEDTSLAAAGSSFVASVEGGAAVYVPILTTDGSTTVIRVFVPAADMTEGVTRSRIILSLLGLSLVAISAWVADRLGRSMVEPVEDLSHTANELGQGDLTARVEPAGPPEIADLGRSFNRLADQVGRLLQEERESAADLAHRLRTPLTAARLNVDGLPDGPQKDRIAADLDNLERTSDFIIKEARRPVRREEEAWSDLGLVTAERVAFWLPLVHDQDRDITVDITDVSCPVSIPVTDVEAMVDALIENAISHTPDGTRFAVVVTVTDHHVVLCVEDAGPGFVDASAIERGESGRNSSGLGLDIVRRTVEESGGTLAIGDSVELGGAGIVVRLPVVATD
jgi:signal transduction histidine kinase